MSNGDNTDWADAIIADAFETDVDGFQRVLAVLPARRRNNQAPLLRLGRRGLNAAGTRRALLLTHHGVFLPHATRQQARQWAQNWAHRLGGTVREDPPHGAGLPHFHVELPQGQSSGHIFYGTPPAGNFFDDD